MDANLILHFFVFQVLPYVVITTLLVGSFVRWLVAPYSWKSQSSKLLGEGKNQMNWGANLFHIGVILLFFGHILGLLVPQPILVAVGLTPPVHQMVEIMVGGFALALTLLGILMMGCRRLFKDRIRRTSRPSDFLVLLLIFIVLCLGGCCVMDALLTDRSGLELIQFGDWAKGIFLFDPNAWTHMVDAPIWQQCHVFVGLLIFLCVPFTRLVHIWSGYFSPVYLFKPKQLMRMRRTVTRENTDQDSVTTQM